MSILIVEGAALYVDPSLAVVVIPLTLVKAILDAKVASHVAANFGVSFMVWSGVFGLLLLYGGDIGKDLLNYFNIFAIVDHSENIGLYWYVMVEIFTQHTQFYQVLYLAFIGMITSQNIFLLSNQAQLLNQIPNISQEVYQSRALRILLQEIFVCSFIKMTMYQYPTLLDLNILLFVALLNLNMILKHVEGLIIIGGGIIYCIMNTIFMWITWIDRFSGNANYFYFQTIAYNLFLALLFIQLYKAIDKKRKKIQKLLLPN